VSPQEAFGADWLSLREPVDHQARSASLTHALREALAGPGTQRILDLGAGHGSNLRYLAPRLGGRQRWLLIDHDAGLLERAQLSAPDLPGLTVACRCMDLRDLTALAGDPVDLVTASALLDLVSADWIGVLAGCIHNWSASALISLSVDGRRGFIDPRGGDCDQPVDQAMAQAFNDHQRQNKGLGQALGPRAAPALASALEALDYRVELARSDWRLMAGQPGTLALASELLNGWAQAVAELGQISTREIERWQARRISQLEQGELGLRVGHLDLLALPRR